MRRSLCGFGRLDGIFPYSRKTGCGGLVAGLARGVPDTPRAGCRGSQMLSVSVGCFGCEAITIPELSGMLPTRMQKATTAFRTRTDLETHFTGVLHLEHLAVVL
jgi:hypothetical protein